MDKYTLYEVYFHDLENSYVRDCYSKRHFLISSTDGKCLSLCH